MRLFLTLVASIALAGCGGSTIADLGTTSVVGTYALASQAPVNPAGVFIPDTDTYIIYSSDVFTLTTAGQWTRNYVGATRMGSTSTPTSGTYQGTYIQNGRGITFQTTAGAYASTVVNGSSFALQDKYYIYTYTRAP
jgi:hypothetical protein